MLKENFFELFSKVQANISSVRFPVIQVLKAASGIFTYVNELGHDLGPTLLLSGASGDLLQGLLLPL